MELFKYFSNYDHNVRYQEAIETWSMLHQDAAPGIDVCVLLYVLTVLPGGIYKDRIEFHVSGAYVDIDSVLSNNCFSMGETLVIKYASNLYNGNYAGDFSPADLTKFLDKSTLKVALEAFRIRARI